HLTPSEEALFTHVFIAGKKIELIQVNHSVLGAAKTAHQKALKQRFKPRYFIDNTAITVKGCLATVALVAMGFWLVSNTASFTFWGLLLALVLLNIVFGWLMRRPTIEGRRLLDHIDGLKLYMKVASKDDIARLEHRN